MLLGSSKGIDGEKWSPRLTVPSVGKQRDIGPRWFQWQKDAGWVRRWGLRKAVDALAFGLSTGRSYFTCGAKYWRGSCHNWLQTCQLGNLYPGSLRLDQVHCLGAQSSYRQDMIMCLRKRATGAPSSPETELQAKRLPHFPTASLSAWEPSWEPDHCEKVPTSLSEMHDIWQPHCSMGFWNP